jgi:hypothetical protein
MKKLFPVLLAVTVFYSCTKSSPTINSNNSADSTNPALLPIGTFVANVDGVKTYFDSTEVIVTNVNQYLLNISALHIDTPNNAIDNITLLMSNDIPLKDTNFTSNNLWFTYEIDANTNQPYVTYYDVTIGPPATANITFVDTAQIQGTFSAVCFVVPPDGDTVFHRFTNGMFNLKASIRSYYFSNL